MVDFAKLVLQADSTQIEKGEIALKKLAATGASAEGATKKLGTAAKTSAAQLKNAKAAAEKLGVQMKSGAGHATNLGYQLNDIGVMLAAGQSPLLLAFQQGTQVSQVFNQMGGGTNALKGLGAAFKSVINPMSIATLGVIGFGAWGVQSLVKLIPKTETLEERMEKLSETVRRFSEASDLAFSSTDQLGARFGSASENVQNLMLAMSEQQRFLGINQAKDALKEFTETYGGFSEKVEDKVEYINRYTLQINKTFAKIQDKFKLGDYKTLDLVLALKNLSDAEGVTSQVDAAKNLLNVLGEVFDKDIPEEFQKIAAGATKAALDLATLTADQSLIADKAGEKQIEKLKQKIGLENSLLVYGRDSLEVQKLKNRQELDNFELTLKSSKANVTIKNELLKQFKTLQDKKLLAWQISEGDIAQANAQKMKLFGLESERDIIREQIKLGGDGLALYKFKSDKAREAYLLELDSLNLTESLYSSKLAQFDAEARIKSEIEAAKIELQESEKAAKSLAAALKSAGDWSAGLDDNISILTAEISAIKAGADAAISGQITMQKLKAANARESRIAAGLDLGFANKIYDAEMKKIGVYQRLLTEKKGLTTSTRASTKATRASTKSLTDEQRQVERLTTAYQNALPPFEKFNNEVSRLEALKKHGLSDEALAHAVQKLRDELAASIPMLNQFSDFIGDTVVNGRADFKSLADSFKSMLSRMIADAAKNKIMLYFGSHMTNFAAGIEKGLSAVFGGGFKGLFGGGLASSLGALVPVLGAVSGAVSFFSTKTKTLDKGLRLTANGAGLVAEEFSKLEKSRFWGMSKKTSTNYNSYGGSSELQKAYASLHSNITGIAADLGVGAAAFDDFKYKMNLSLKGLSEEQQKAKIAEEFTKMGDALASFSGVDTVEELTTIRNSLLAANSSFADLGLALYDVSIMGAQAAQNLIDQFESLDAFTQSTGYYFQNFYSEEERLAANTKSLTDQLAALGYSLPTTTAQFRMLVDGMREMGDDEGLASLLKIAPLFKDIADAQAQYLDNLVGNAESSLKEAEDAVQGAYDAAVKTIDAERDAVLNEWQGLLDEAAQATKKAADELDRRFRNVTAIFDSLSDSLSGLIDVAAEKANASRRILDSLNSALSDRNGLQKAEMLRAQALSVVRSGNREQLDNALSVLGKDSQSQHSDRISWALQYAQETAAIEALRDQTKSQLTVEEKALGVLETQQSQLTSISELLKQQISIASGQSVSLKEAVSAVLGGNVTLIDLKSMSAEKLSSLISSSGLVEAATDYVSSGISSLTTATEQEKITQAAANLQISSAEKKHSEQIEALNKSVSGILKLDTSILSMSSSMSGLNVAINNLADAQAAAQAAQQELLKAQAAQAEADRKLREEREKQRKIAEIKAQMQSEISGLGSKPGELSIIKREANAKTWLNNLKSHIWLSDGSKHSYEGGDKYNEIRVLEARVAPLIAQSKAAATKWQTEYNNLLQTYRDQIKALGGTPSFASGGFHMGGARIVGERGPELEITGPSRIHSNSETKSMLDNRAVVEELKSLRQELSALKDEQRERDLARNKSLHTIERKTIADEEIGAAVRVLEAT